MRSQIVSRFVVAASMLSLCSAVADTGEAHLARYKNGVLGDKTIKAARKLKVDIPVYAREWHIWWGAPLGDASHMPTWQHWKGQKVFGEFNQETTLEKTRPSSQWRRWLNCVGYPLLGPYDSSQPDIIRWQMETAKNAGIDALHIQLWPTLWDTGVDMTPLPIFDTIMKTAEALDFPVAVHDEIQFRPLDITQAQTLESSIQRSILLLKRYGTHAGWQKIDGMPVYYFQNWSKWISAKDLETYFETVEKEVGPVYWIVEMAPLEEYFKVPQIKAIVSHGNGWFLHTPPYGEEPHPWEMLEDKMRQDAALARQYGKKFGIQVKTRFNHTLDRGSPDRPKIISGKDGMFLVEAVKRSMKIKPDFLVLAQWNDFEEGGFIEPAWDFDGFNGDPYRYCRITAALTGKTFVPVSLPERSQLDPFIRKKLFGDTQPGDMGPVFQEPRVENGTLKVKWAEDSNPRAMGFFQGQLASWIPEVRPFRDEKLRLANYGSVSEEGRLVGENEMRFYAPGLATKQPLKLWFGIRLDHDPVAEKVHLYYRSNQDNFRRDCRWLETRSEFKNGYAFKMKDGTVFYWTPLYDAMPNGREGDFVIRIEDQKGSTRVHEVVIWSPAMAGINVAPSASMAIPSGISASQPFVAVGYDAAKNPGPPMLILPATDQLKK